TDGCVAAAPAVTVCDVTLFAMMFCAAPARPEALNVIVVPTPVVVAVTVLLFVPAVCPSVHELIAAMPLLPVLTIAGLPGAIEPPAPPGAVSVKVTGAPLTGLLNWSRTRTAGDIATAVPTVDDVDGVPLTTMEFATSAVPVAVN